MTKITQEWGDITRVTCENDYLTCTLNTYIDGEIFRTAPLYASLPDGDVWSEGLTWRWNGGGDVGCKDNEYLVAKSVPLVDKWFKEKAAAREWDPGLGVDPILAVFKKAVASSEQRTANSADVLNKLLLDQTDPDTKEKK